MFLNLLFSHAWSSSWQLRLLLRRTWFKVATVQIFCARSNCSLSGDQTQLEIGTTSILTIAIVKITVSTKWGENYDLSLSLSEQWESGACGCSKEGELREFSIDRHHRAKRRNGWRSSWTSDLWKGNKCSLATIRLIFYIRKELCKGEWKYLQDFCFGSGKPREEQVCTGYSSERLRVGYRW